MNWSGELKWQVESGELKWGVGFGSKRVENNIKSKTRFVDDGIWQWGKDNRGNPKSAAGKDKLEAEVRATEDKSKDEAEVKSAEGRNKIETEVKS